MKAAARVAWNLRQLRVKRGLSQEALATDAGVDTSHVSRLERGLENPTVGMLERLAKCLNADITDLVRVPAKGERRPRPLLAGRRPK
jgi:transcriptional regulator with XRE-family HTH domain